MSQRSKRWIAVCSVLLIVAAGATVPLASLLGGGGEDPAPPPENPGLTDVGAFRLGSARALERSGFTGCPLVYVFVSPEDKDLAAVDTARSDPSLTPIMAWYTGVLVNTEDSAEAELEKELRAEGFRVVVRSMSGQYLGALKAGFSATDLAKLLATTRADHPGAVSRSPLYSLLRAKPDAIQSVVEMDGREKAEALTALMAECEGEESPAVAALRAELRR